MNIGYACLTLGVPGTEYRTLRQKDITPSKMREIIAANLDALERVTEYNHSMGIRLFRITSDLIPFGSSPENPVSWAEEYAEKFRQIGKKIHDYGIRVSMHPGQYTVLNSPNPDVVSRSIEDLIYHGKVLDALETDATSKIILHVGGTYGDREAAIRRFIDHHRGLPEAVRRRLIIENDDRSFTIQEVLRIANELGIPAVFDNLHNEINPSANPKTESEWVMEAGKTWKAPDGKQKLHYSQQDPSKQRGSHSFTIAIDPFLDFVGEIVDADVMLEVKDKNWSAVKCWNCLRPDREIKHLEAEWARYKYLVLERDPQAYQAIRGLLKEKNTYPVLNFYRWIERALAKPASLGHSMNALEHIAGYFKDLASETEKKTINKKMDKCRNGALSIDSAKRFFWDLAWQHHVDYLIHSYFFVKKEQLTPTEREG